jgi:hypothetical protein
MRQDQRLEATAPFIHGADCKPYSRRPICLDSNDKTRGAAGLFPQSVMALRPLNGPQVTRQEPREPKPGKVPYQPIRRLAIQLSEAPPDRDCARTCFARFRLPSVACPPVNGTFY